MLILNLKNTLKLKYTDSITKAAHRAAFDFTCWNLMCGSFA